MSEGVSWLLVRTLASGADPADAEVIGALFGTAPMPPMPLYMLVGAGVACALVTACVALGERCGDSAWLRPFVSTGQLALTLYVGHVIVGLGTLEALGRLHGQALPFAVLASAVFCVAGVVFAWVWRLRFEWGPLVAIMRFATESRKG